MRSAFNWHQSLFRELKSPNLVKCSTNPKKVPISAFWYFGISQLGSTGQIVVVSNVGVQGVVALGGRFATLCQEVDFFEANIFSVLIFEKKRQILLHF
jgi:hypothetical protein